MKSESHKARIVIPQLIKKINIKQANKQNVNKLNLNSSQSHQTNSQSNKNDKNRKQKDKQFLNGVLKYKMRVSEYMNESNQESMDRDIGEKGLQIKTSYSTDRTCEQMEAGDSCQKRQKGEKQMIGSGIEGVKLQKLSALLSNNKMFINPDRWGQFVGRATKDEQFHKALNAFMYSYFIEHYN